MDEPMDGPTGAAFIRNDGQVEDADVLFYITTTNGLLSFLKSEVRLTMLELASVSPRKSNAPTGSAQSIAQTSAIHTLEEAPLRGCNLRFTFEGSSMVDPTPRESQPSTFNFFSGDDPDRWRCGVPSYREIVFENLYDGIDLVYRSMGERVKYEFIARPGSNPSEILILVQGHQGLAIDPSGALQIFTPLGAVADRGLSVFYQDNPSERLRSSFTVHREDLYGFHLEESDPGRALVIDPVIYSTYLVGSKEDLALDVACDDDMDIYLTGKTFSTEFPTSPGMFTSSRGLDTAVFVSKLTADGSSLVYSTLIKGSSVEEGRGIGVDSRGNAVVTGQTFSDDFPTTNGALQTNNGSYEDAFLLKLNHDGSRLEFSTYLSGSLLDEGNDVAVGDHDDIFVVGTTRSQDFPITPGSFQTVLIERSTSAFLSKVSSDGASLIFSTFLGDSSEGRAIVLDREGAPLVTGEGGSMPITFGAYQPWYGGGSSDAYVSKISVDGTRLEFSTLLGGDSWDIGTGIALDGAENVYVTGYTSSPDFPTTEGAFKSNILTRFSDGFVCKITMDGRNLEYGTFLGGEGSEYPMDIGVNRSGAAFIIGWTDSEDFPVTQDAFQSSLGGMDDAFVCKLSEDAGSLVLSSFLGGRDHDRAFGMAVTHSEIAYIVGSTASPDFPTTEGAFDETGGGREDAFMVKLNTDTESPRADAGEDMFIDQHVNVTFDGTGSRDNVGIVRWSWVFEYNEEGIDLPGPDPSIEFHTPGTYLVTLYIWDDLDHMGSDMVMITVRDSTPPLIEAGPDQEVEQHTLVSLNGTGSTDNIGIDGWAWTFEYDGEEVMLDGPEVTFTFDLVGTYVVVLNVTDSSGNYATDEINIIVLDITPPVADAGEDILVDQHTAVVFDGGGSSDNQHIVNWTWMFQYDRKEVFIHGPSPSFNFDHAGVYEVTLQVIDTVGLHGTDSINVTVRDTTPPIASMGEDISVSPHDVLELDATRSSDNVGIVQWTFQFLYGGLLIKLSGPRTNFTFELTGNITILLNVTDAAGNWATDEITVSVKDLMSPVAIAGSDRTVDVDEIVVLDGQQSYDNIGIVQWKWSFEYDGLTITLDGSVVMFTFERPGVVPVSLNVYDEAGNWATTIIIVNVRDGVPPVANAGPDQEIEAGTKAILNGTLSSDNLGIFNWTWTIETGDKVKEMFGPIQEISLEQSGDYRVTLTVQDKAGNLASDTLYINVYEDEATNDGGYFNFLVIIFVFIVLIIIIFIALRYSEKYR
jgi:hypothetical protein